MLFRNGDIEISVREAFRERQQIRAFAHGGGNTAHTIIQFSRITQPLAENVRILLRRRDRFDWLWLAGGYRFNFVYSVVANGIGFRRGKALALGRYHVEELRPLKLADIFQRLNQ